MGRRKRYNLTNCGPETIQFSNSVCLEESEKILIPKWNYLKKLNNTRNNYPELLLVQALIASRALISVARSSTMPRKLFRTLSALVLILLTNLALAQHHKSSANSPLDQYVEQVSELSSRARANVYFANPQSIFRGVQVNFVNVGTGNLTFLRRDLVASGRIPLVFARVYDSSGKGSVDFGPGWTVSAAESITVADSKAHLLTENGSTIDFVKVDESAFTLEKEYPSDYMDLRLVDASTLETKLRTGFTKQFQLIGDAFRLVKVTDRNGNEVRLSYNNGLLNKIENANHSITILRNAKGRILSAQDDQNRSVQFAYDAQGRLIEVDDLGGNAWTYNYNGDGKLKAAKDPLQRLNFGVFFHDDGRVRRLQLPSGIIQFNYDAATRSTTVLDRKSLVSRFIQDEDGITTRVVNPLGEETAIALDSSRNVLSLSRNGSVIERMEYDQQHRITTRHSTLESSTVDRTYSYDPATGQLAGIHSSNAQDESFTYDENGNLASAVLPDGKHTFRFSSNGDLAGLSASTANLTFSPNPDGLFAAMNRGQNARTELRYKAGSQLQEVTFPGGTKGNFEYQPSGLRSKLILSDGGRAEYNYDPAGNLTASKVFDQKGKQINGQKLEMDESYQLTRWTLFDGTVTDFKYDRNGNLTEIKKGKSITRFEYDAVNRLNAVITPAGQRLTYTYKPGERSLIEQHQHAAVLMEALHDTGLTFAGTLQVTATRPVTGLIGFVRFSETLGTFQLSGSDGAEILKPQDRIEPALKKLFLFDPSVSAAGLRSGFNIPFNAMFIPAEYVTINCCPMCYDDGGEWYCPPCFVPPPPPPCPDAVSISTATQMSLADNYPVIRTGIGIIAGMQVTPISTDWGGTEITESVTPGAINTCPASFGSCSGSSIFTVGEGGGDWGVTLPPQQNIFYDEHSQTNSISLLDAAGINSCQRTCSQVYTCNGTPIGSFTINRTFTKGLIQGDHVTVVTVTKQ
jgi:YD repeat-containing protein